MPRKRRGIRGATCILLGVGVYSLGFQQAFAVADGAVGLRMPFVGPRDILSGGGPGCSSTHQGRNAEAIDYKMPLDTAIFAVEGGTVQDTTTYTGAGLTVRISHPAQGTYSRYLHLKSQNVAWGQEVKKGQLIARSGDTGLPPDDPVNYPPHLHFQVETLPEPNGQTIYIRDLPKTTWVPGGDICVTGNQAQGPQITGRVYHTIGSDPPSWPPRAFWPNPPSGPIGPWLEVVGGAPRAYADQYGYFHLFDVLSGTWPVRAEKHHFGSSDGANPTNPPFTPLSTRAESAPITIDGSMATTMKDIRIRLADADQGADDNVIDIEDFSVLLSSFGKVEGEPGYRRGSDFREEDETSILGFSTLLVSFGQNGSDPAGWTTLVLDGNVTP